MVLILDIDNCISDDQWRLKYIRSDYQIKQGRDLLRCFDDYNSLAGFDESHLERFEPDIAKADYLIFNTSRPNKFRTLTTEWLVRAGVEFPFQLIMRHNYDYRPSEVVKSDNLRICLEGLAISNPEQLQGCILAFDDHPKVVEAYSRLASVEAIESYINLRTHKH